MKSIYRKLKDYIYHNCKENSIDSIFGSLYSSHVDWTWKDEKGNWQHWTWCGTGLPEHNYLLDYYVLGVYPKYKIEEDKIKAYITVTLQKEIL